jgi:hypothetical protein
MGCFLLVMMPTCFKTGTQDGWAPSQLDTVTSKVICRLRPPSKTHHTGSQPSQARAHVTFSRSVSPRTIDYIKADGQFSEQKAYSSKAYGVRIEMPCFLGIG